MEKYPLTSCSKFYTTKRFGINGMIVKCVHEDNLVGKICVSDDLSVNESTYDPHAEKLATRLLFVSSAFDKC